MSEQHIATVSSNVNNNVCSSKISSNFDSLSAGAASCTYTHAHLSIIKSFTFHMSFSSSAGQNSPSINWEVFCPIVSKCQKLECIVWNRQFLYAITLRSNSFSKLRPGSRFDLANIQLLECPCTPCTARVLCAALLWVECFVKMEKLQAIVKPWHYWWWL